MTQYKKIQKHIIPLYKLKGILKMETNQKSYFQDTVFQNLVKRIRYQLESNKDLIQQADVVFVCGKVNTGLTLTSNIIGTILHNLKTTTKVEESNCNSSLPLTFVNSEIFTSDLIDLLFNIDLPVKTKFLHITNNAYIKYSETDVEPTYTIDGETNITSLLKRSTCVIVDDKESESSIKNVLLFKLINKAVTSTYVQVMRIHSKNNDECEDEFKALHGKFSMKGLKVVFIRTVKNKETGIVDLVFHT